MNIKFFNGLAVCSLLVFATPVSYAQEFLENETASPYTEETPEEPAENIKTFYRAGEEIMPTAEPTEPITKEESVFEQVPKQTDLEEQDIEPEPVEVPEPEQIPLEMVEQDVKEAAPNDVPSDTSQQFWYIISGIGLCIIIGVAVFIVIRKKTANTISKTTLNPVVDRPEEPQQMITEDTSDRLQNALDNIRGETPEKKNN